MKNLSLSISFLTLAGVLSASTAAYADVGRITSGAAGWNTENVVTKFFDAEGNPTDILDEGDIYMSYVYDKAASDTTATHMGSVIAKNPPVGEPQGVKVVNGEKNCIISTAFLDEADYEADPDAEADYSNQNPVTCSSPFMTHKRYKVLMLPKTVDGGIDSVDMVFNVENDATSTDSVIPYTIYQKINNWTDSRLEGYTLQVGFGIGADFTESTDGTLTFDNTDDSTYSHGLFGPIEEGKFPENGFFSSDKAGYEAFTKDDPSNLNLTTFTSSDVVGTYAAIEGTWLPASWVPYGIFFDDDGDPDTDATLMAWWGKGTDETYQWMYGQLAHYTADTLPEGMTEDFAAVPAQQIADWLPETIVEGTVNPYSIGLIDDFANLNLNYTVNVGDITGWTGTTFTIRVTPTKSDDAAPEYTQEANLPPQLGDVPVVVQPEPEPEEEDDDSSGGGFGFDGWILLLIAPLLARTFRRKKSS